MKYSVILEQSEEGFAVSVPGLPGCHSHGATETEALENIRRKGVRAFFSFTFVDLGAT